MKKFRLLSILSILCLISGLTSCKSTDDVDAQILLALNTCQISYGENDVWVDTYTENTSLECNGISFSHTANPAWNVWNGFVATRNSDNTDYSTGNWLEHQWTSMSKGGMSGAGTPHLVAYWNNTETADVEAAKASCRIYIGNELQLSVYPQYVYLNNTSYTYYTMKNGSAYSKKFAKGDYLKLNIYGYSSDKGVVGPVEFYLADYRSDNTAEWKLISEWTYVNLEQLGSVEYIYFQMESSDVGQWGINTPTYFALDRLNLKL
ncbi:MAG: DUF4465 domain-containing protein [Muribaculaceae bacterium]|nr:DUF4465 domain-containing protein [Muribaculaceae bacterium]